MVKLYYKLAFLFLLWGDKMKKICRIKGKKGFTLVEIGIIIVILAILAALIFPGFLKYIDRQRVESCATNRATLVKSFEFFSQMKNGATLTEEIAAYTHIKCPSGGTYTASADDKEVICSIHGSDSGTPDPDDPDDEDDPDDTGDEPELPDGTIIEVTGDWGALLAQASASSGHISFNTSGDNVYSDSSGIYIFATDSYTLYKSDGDSKITIEEFATRRSANIIRIRTDLRALTEADWAGPYGPWKAEAFPVQGRVYSYGGSLYAFMNASGNINASTNPNWGGWLKMF